LGALQSVSSSRAQAAHLSCGVSGDGPKPPRGGDAMNRIAMQLLTLALTSLVLPFAARCAEEAADPNGKPKKFVIGKEPIYAVWYADGAWHVRATAKKGEASKFHGSIKLEGGVFTEGSFENLERGRKKGLHDWVAVERDQKSCRFIFDNTGKSDGLDFKVSETTRNITFGLLIGAKTPTENVLIGLDGTHPATNPFTIKAHPEPTLEKPAAKKKGK
jgi:hypothetical protein